MPGQASTRKSRKAQSLRRRHQQVMQALQQLLIALSGCSKKYRTSVFCMSDEIEH